MVRNYRHSGYVLVTTLLLLAVAGVALSSVAAESYGRAIEALRAQDELQRQWGILSCQHAFLPEASQILDAFHRRPDNIPGRATLSLRLGGQDFTLLLADEQAKANVNTLAGKLDAQQLQGALQRLSGDRSQEALRLLPSHTSEVGSNGKRIERLTFLTYGQIFDNPPPSALLDGLASNITCWGDGRLNMATASTAAIAECAASILRPDEEHRFRQAHQRFPRRAWSDIFKDLDFLPDRTEAMQKQLIALSTCHSLWICADARRDRPLYSFAVQEGDRPSIVFQW